MNKNLGRKVRFNRVIKKTRISNGCEWIEEEIEPCEGVIIGKRTVLSGLFNGEGRYRFIPNNRHQVYLISKNMCSKPIRIPIDAIDNNQAVSWFE